MRVRVLTLAALMMACAREGPALAEPELAGQAVVTLVTDQQTKGGGAGAAIEGTLPVLHGVPLVREAFRQDSALVLRARASVLTGLGLAWTVEVGAAVRAREGRWEPHLGLYALYMDGQLVRAIDERGRRAGGPLALLVGLDPLRFALESGWVSFLAARCGRVLSHAGPFVSALSLSLVEVGHRFE